MNKLEAYHQQLEAERAARDARRAEQQAWLAAVQARRDAIARGELAPEAAAAGIPRLASLAQQQRIANAVAAHEQAISVATGVHRVARAAKRLSRGAEQSTGSLSAPTRADTAMPACAGTGNGKRACRVRARRALSAIADSASASADA